MLVSLKMLYLVLNVFIIVPCNELEDNDMIEQLFGIGSVKVTNNLDFNLYCLRVNILKFFFLNRKHMVICIT